MLSLRNLKAIRKRMRLRNDFFLCRTRGAAILLALFVVALVAAAAFTMLESLSVALRRTTLILHDSEAYHYAEGAREWAKDLLVQNQKQTLSNHSVEKMPVKSAVT